MKNLILITLFLLPLNLFCQSDKQIYVKNDTVLTTVLYTPEQFYCGHYQLDTIWLVRSLYIFPYRLCYDADKWCNCIRYSYEAYLDKDKKTNVTGKLIAKVKDILKQ